jgi:hypothetical protein
MSPRVADLSFESGLGINKGMETVVAVLGLFRLFRVLLRLVVQVTKEDAEHRYGDGDQRNADLSGGPDEKGAGGIWGYGKLYG